MFWCGVDDRYDSMWWFPLSHIGGQWTWRIDRWLQMNWLRLRKLPVEVWDFKKFTDHFRGIWRLHLKLFKKERKKTKKCQHVTGWIWKTLKPQPVMSKMIPGHCQGSMFTITHSVGVRKPKWAYYYPIPGKYRPMVPGRKAYLMMSTSSFTNTLTLFWDSIRNCCISNPPFCNQLLISFFFFFLFSPFDFLGVTYPEYERI